MRVLVLFALIALAVATPWHQLEAVNYDFEMYKQEFNKQYSSAQEESMREVIFGIRLKAIIAHNNEAYHSWKKGVNQLTDRTAAELKQLRGYRRDLMHAYGPETNLWKGETTPEALPSFVDWRQKGAVSPVKDQGQCGSCWTFASSETIESAYYMKTGVMEELSEQQIASCSPNPKSCGGTGGCAGGTAEIAFAGVIANGGISSEWVYPYMSHAGDDHQCMNRSKAITISSYVKLPVNDQDALMQAVATVGPIAISVDASVWHDYESGVFSGCDMTNPTIDHAVQLVGYGTDSESGLDYWLVRNSWTPRWGEGGYIRIARPKTPVCGTDNDPCDGTACKPCPESITVCGMCGILSDSAYPVV